MVMILNGNLWVVTLLLCDMNCGKACVCEDGMTLCETRTDLASQVGQSCAEILWDRGKRPLSDQPEPALVLDDSCLKQRDFGLSLMGQVKEVSAIPNLYIILAKEGFDSVKLSYLGGLSVLFEFDSLTSMEKFRNHVGIGSWFSTIKAALALKWGDLVVWEEFEEISLSCKHICLKIKVDEIINESFKIIVKGKVFWIRIKELDAWIPKFLSDNNDSSSDTNSTVHEEGCKLGDYENEIRNVDSDVEQLLQQKKENLPQSKDFDPTHPPGFTPDIHNKNNEEGSNSLKDKEKSNTSLGHKAKKGWIQELCSKHKINFVALQETKSESIDLFSIKALWGNLTFDHAISPSVGNSGGILCVWDPNLFIKEHVSSSDYFLAVMGTWSPSSTKLLVISMYAPQELTEKRDLWDYLCSLIDRWDGETVILGDFNEVRSNHERFGSSFNIQGANAFNNFISMAGLIDLPLGGGGGNCEVIAVVRRYSRCANIMFISSLKTLRGSRGESFWEDGDDFGVDVLRFHTCLTDILGFLETLEWWFEQDINDEGEEGDSGSE
ncbi:RNA-directed DNA polymerase, eukaryota, partial [Tanacetum coccineum]